MKPALNAAAADPKEYRPRTGSLAWRVIKFLQDNPEEELSREDIAVKFSTFAGGVDGNLTDAVAADILRKRRESSGTVMWLLGARGIDLGDAGPGPAPAVIGMEMLPPIRKNQPLMDEKARRVADFMAWLEKFDVNDSAEFSVAMRAEMRRMVTQYEQTSGRKFILLKTGVARMGVQRTE